MISDEIISKNQLNKSNDTQAVDGNESSQPNDATPAQHQPRRNVAFSYKILVEGGFERTVCKKAFAGLHGIKFGRIDRISNYKTCHRTPPLDRRGTSEHSRVLKKPEQLHARIVEHISSFPLIKSPNQKRKVLPDYLSISKMHEMYVQMYEPESYDAWKANKKKNVKLLVSYEYYRNIFKTEFNLSFEKASPVTPISTSPYDIKKELSNN